MSTSNGRGSGLGQGYGSGAEARLLKKLQEHQRKADALQLALDILREDAVVKKGKRQASVLNGALAIEAARLTQKKKKKIKDDPGYNTASALRMRRQHSADVLKVFDGTPKTHAEAGLPKSDGQIVGSLARYGYLKRKGKGRNARFVRTAKVYTETPAWKTSGE